MALTTASFLEFDKLTIPLNTTLTLMYHRVLRLNVDLWLASEDSK